MSDTIGNKPHDSASRSDVDVPSDRGIDTAGQRREFALHLGPEARPGRVEIAAKLRALDHHRGDRDRRRGDQAAERDARHRASDKGGKGHPHRHCRM